MNRVVKLSALAIMPLVAAFALAACGGKNLEIKKIAATENPTDQIASLGQAIDKARAEKVNVLSPAYFAKSEESLRNAKELQKEGRRLETLFEAVARGRADLDRANEMAAVARTALPNAIKARDDARVAGASTFETDYNQAESEFRKLTASIEDNDLEDAKRSEARVTQTFRNLELRAIKEKALGEARTVIQEAERKEAKKIVPATYATAQKKLAEADAFISQNRYNKEELLKKANDAIFHAHRLEHILNQSLALRKQTPEQNSLWAEGMLTEIAKTLAAPDMRNQGFKTQVENINGTIQGLQDSRAFLDQKVKTQDTAITGLNEKVASLEGTSQDQQEAKARLEAEKRFNQRYGEVRTYFKGNEAEVYKQGDQLLIRMKAMQFPVGKSVIMPDNYPLLTKVQRAIRTFGEPSVTIEGHTDTTGSAATNEQLSQERAEAVKKYLVANGTLADSKLMSVGFGPSKPIAPNTTTEGRAQNRRIDVVITPDLSGSTK